MVKHSMLAEAFEVQSSGSHSPVEVQGEALGTDMEHIKPEFRERLATLASWGLLAVGVRIILQENGFCPDIPRRHCGCPACAQRCSVCAEK